MFLVMCNINNAWIGVRLIAERLNEDNIYVTLTKHSSNQIIKHLTLHVSNCIDCA